MIDYLSVFESTQVYKLALPAVAIFCAAFFRWRAGSSHLLLDKLLRLVFGKTSIHDPELNKMIEETHDLEQVRIRYGIQVMNTPALKRLMEWCKTFSVSFHELGRIRDYVKPETSQILAPPPKSELLASAIVFMVSLILFSSLLVVAAVPAAIITSKASGRNYLMAQDHAERFSLSAKKFTADSCAMTAAQTEDDRELCSFVSDPRYREVIGPMIRQQRQFGLLMLIVTFPGVWYFGGIFFAARRAIELSKRINSSLPERQGLAVENR